MAVLKKIIIYVLMSAFITCFLTLFATDFWLIRHQGEFKDSGEVILFSESILLASARKLKNVDSRNYQESSFQQNRTQEVLKETELATQRPVTSQSLDHAELSKTSLRWTSNQEFAKRKYRVQQICERSNVKGDVHGVYTHQSGVIYCFVPKAGCTFWKRVFTAANSQSIQDPFSLSRNYVHTVNGYGDPFNSYIHNQENYPIRLLVARDPFSRLISTYLDKFYLPDFWPTWAKKLSKSRIKCETDFLRRHFDSIASLFDGWSDGYSTCNDNWCGKYLTFSEFIQSGLHVTEVHWTPIHEICNPCTFNVTHISTMDNFNQDARVILSRMGMVHILDKVELDKNNQVNQEIQMLVDYHFNRTHDIDVIRYNLQCLTPRELAYRLWHSFQWKGYIDPDVTYIVPDSSLTEYSIKSDLLSQVWSARETGLANPEKMKKARERFSKNAFQSVPRSVFEKLMRKYKTDIELFGYEELRNTMYTTLYGDNYNENFIS